MSEQQNLQEIDEKLHGSMNPCVIVQKETITRIVSQYQFSPPSLHGLLNRINELEKEVQGLKEQRTTTKVVEDTQAEVSITEYLIEQKKAGTNKISIVDIVEATKLPCEQVDLIMGKLEAKGVKEVD